MDDHNVNRAVQLLERDDALRTREMFVRQLEDAAELLTELLLQHEASQQARSCARRARETLQCLASAAFWLPNVPPAPEEPPVDGTVEAAVQALNDINGPPERNNPGGPSWVSPDPFGRPPAPVTETTPRREGAGYVYDTRAVQAPDLPEPADAADEMPATVRSTPPPALLAVEARAPDGTPAGDTDALCGEDCPAAPHVHEIDVGEY